MFLIVFMKLHLINLNYDYFLSIYFDYNIFFPLYLVIKFVNRNKFLINYLHLNYCGNSKVNTAKRKIRLRQN